MIPILEKYTLPKDFLNLLGASSFNVYLVNKGQLKPLKPSLEDSEVFEVKSEETLPIYKETALIRLLSKKEAILSEDVLKSLKQETFPIILNWNREGITFVNVPQDQELILALNSYLKKPENLKKLLKSLKQEETQEQWELPTYDIHKHLCSFELDFGVKKNFKVQSVSLAELIIKSPSEFKLNSPHKGLFSFGNRQPQELTIIQQGKAHPSGDGHIITFKLFFDDQVNFQKWLALLYALERLKTSRNWSW